MLAYRINKAVWVHSSYSMPNSHNDESKSQRSVASNRRQQPSSGGQARRWCFTINNYTPEHVEFLRSLPENPEHVRRIIVGRETAASGTNHLQGYVEFDRPTRMGAVKTAIGAGSAHVEKAIGTPEQNSEYCSKEGDVIVDYGTPGNRRQGSRTDLSSVKSLLDSGGSLRDVAHADFATFIRYQRGLQAYSRIIRSEPRNWVTQVVWLYGPTGSGKSRRANQESYDLSGGDVAWIADPTLTWFEPYNGHKGAVIDDFDGKPPLSFLLRLFDRYPLMVPVKGDFVQWRPRIVWITANFTPLDLYGGAPQYTALARRITEIIHVE